MIQILCKIIIHYLLNIHIEREQSGRHVEFWIRALNLIKIKIMFDLLFISCLIFMKTVFFASQTDTKCGEPHDQGIGFNHYSLRA